MKTNHLKNNKPLFTCVFDPLCGWCYGFGPVLIRLQNDFQEAVDFDVISGGMITGNRIGPLSNMASFIRQAYPQVEQRTGIRFGKTFVEDTLAKGNTTNSSLEPAMVLTIFKRFQPENAVVFSHEIQKLIYGDGIDPIDFDAYLPLFNQFGIDPEKVKPLFSSKEMEQETVQEFKKAERWGISGFPTCILQSPDGKSFGVSRGYMDFDSLSLRLHQMLGK